MNSINKNFQGKNKILYLVKVNLSGFICFEIHYGPVRKGHVILYMKLLFLLSTFSVSYMARLEDGTIFEKKGIDGEQPLEFITDEGQSYS